jgi:hypothetical protein
MAPFSSAPFSFQCNGIANMLALSRFHYQFTEKKLLKRCKYKRMKMAFLAILNQRILSAIGRFDFG